MNFEMNDRAYRIWRVDNLNLAIQRLAKTGRWETISYHGSSLKSITTGLMNLITDNHLPADENLISQLKILSDQVDFQTARILAALDEAVKNRSDIFEETL